jgi:hypothetical protein
MPSRISYLYTVSYTLLNIIGLGELYGHFLWCCLAERDRVWERTNHHVCRYSSHLSPWVIGSLNNCWLTLMMILVGEATNHPNSSE